MTRGGWSPPAQDTLPTEIRPPQAGGFRAPCVTQKGRILNHAQKRASDLLDPYVGGTEQRIAAAFAEARETGAFLLFDEADSLLLDRADAVRSWEVSQVNEMLTWMEQHPLPFACTTNLVDRLDRASLRRFLVKVRFEWLTVAQARLAFRGFFGVASPAGLDGLATLTPADFALVRRRVAITGEGSDAKVLLGLLAAECEGRVGGRVAMGFATDAHYRSGSDLLGEMA